MIEIVLPFIDGVALYLNKHESPSPNTALSLLHPYTALCHVLFKLPQLFGEGDENVKSLQQDH